MPGAPFVASSTSNLFRFEEISSKPLKKIPSILHPQILRLPHLPLALSRPNETVQRDEVHEMC